MNLQEFIDRDFGGNISAFARSYNITNATAHRLLKGASYPQAKLRDRLKRKGVHFVAFAQAKLAKNFKAYGLEHDTIQAVLDLFSKGKTLSLEEMRAAACIKIGGEQHSYVLLDGRIYAVRQNKVGNVDDITYFCNTAKEEERNIAAHHDTEYISCSDRAAHLVNGMLFSNGGVDGTNLVKVRTFTAKPEHYYLSRAEIYDRENCFRFDVTQGAKVWASDCADPSTDKPMIDEPNAFTIIVHRHTLYVCVKGW